MKKLLTTLVALAVASLAFGQKQHPCLLLTPDGVAEMRAALGTNADFDASVAEVIAEADRGLAEPIVVPVPKDGGGGYTHEKHKDNYYVMYYCGIAWQLTGKEAYAQKVVDMLDAYAALYPSLGFHPVTLSKTPGRIFWQTLNECVWLVHTSIAYDCVYDFIAPEKREKLERDFFRPYADFVMNGTKENPANNRTFNLMHNHGTWATASVGMLGMVMGDEDIVKQALYGSDKTGKNGGYIMQLDNLLSPDGYYTEGAYYLRYAIWPMMLFAHCIENNLPEVGIFNYRDAILSKAVNALLQLNYNGVFMKFNDALTKQLDCQELLFAVDIAYGAYKNPMLLDVAQKFQKKYIPCDAGYEVARDVAAGKAEPIKYESKLYRDGADGSQGGIGVVRSTRPDVNSALTLKATSHGLSHGHYDKLVISYYDNGNVVLPDYGASRFLNIEAKYKGHYTRENKKYAMQTIAHSTVSVDGKSHFDGNYNESSKHHSDVYYFEAGDKLSVMSAKENAAVKGVKMHRTVIYDDVEWLQYPLIVDIFRLESEKEHTYDLPFWYSGHMVSLNFPYTKALTSMTTLGVDNGYQYIWVEAEGRNEQTLTSCYTFLEGDRFYSISTATTPATEMKMLRLGANDPDYNLRPEGAYMLRQKAANHSFVSTIESHGVYNLQVEKTANAKASVKEVVVLVDIAKYTVVRVDFVGGQSRTYCFANEQTEGKHKVKAGGKTYTWEGALCVE